MFGALKEKLKKWIEKTKEKDESLEKEVEEKKSKKKKEKAVNKKKPVKEKKKEKTPKKEKKEETAEELIEEVRIEDEVEEIIEEEKLEEAKEEIIEKKSFFSRFVKKYSEEDFNSDFEELELILLQNNVAYEAIEFIKEELKNRLVGKNFKEIDLAEEIKNSIKELLIEPPNFIKKIKDSINEKRPFVIILAGINGSGKTTTIAKLTNLLQKNKLSVCLAAADTFRAASIEQLKEHADRLGVKLISKDYGVDPAAVGFEAVAYAKKNNIDVVLIDTAGRMQNRDSLMREMEKIVRVNKPDMKIFIGESITGNDAIEQARTFNETIDISGIILSKADVDEKGGTAISVSFVTKKPIYFLGVGQEYNDLEEFTKEKLIQRLGL
jgi:fused signal recognition particle receptor